MATYTYRLPFPPSVNHYWKRNGHQYYIAPPGREFRAEVVATCAGDVTLEGRLAVSLELVMPDRRRRDIDNYHKSVLDSLCHANVFVDDRQIDELRVKRLHVEPPGCCDVTIEQLEDA